MSDQVQREQALDANQSFIIQAPAGSGKTTLIIQRFLTLLSHVKSPEEVLAITFTKKAANEMRLRVINALKQASYEPEPTSIHAKKTWSLARSVLRQDQAFHWNLLNNPNQLPIQTIDALCAYLTKQLPLLSHFGSQPDISDTPTLLYQEAVQEVLMHVEENFIWSDAIAKLLLHLDNDLNKLHELLVSLLAKRDQWLPYLHLDTNQSAIKKQLERHLARVITDHLQSIQALFPKELTADLCTILRFAADNLTRNGSDTPLMACKNLLSLPGTQPHDHRAWLEIAHFLLTNDQTWRKQLNANMGFPPASQAKNPQEKMAFSGQKSRALALLSQLNDHEDLRLALSGLAHLPRSHYQDAQWEILQALLHVLKISAAQLRLIFQQHGQIDFIENAQAAIMALGHDDCPTDLALALDYQIKHILVDEFQDTSFTQYHLLEKLIAGWQSDDGRTLFVVGDPMQSIYRFREAEVGLFIRMQSYGIGNIRLIPLTLTTNFRSTKKIVGWNNYHFQTIFPSVNDIATGSITYSPCVSCYPEEDSENSSVNVLGFSNQSEEAQANAIVSIINDRKKNHPHEKIAILVRARPHLKTILPALKKAMIPYRAIEIDSLSESQTIQDLLSLTRALLHPADRIAWLAILRAPWCGLTLADLLIIAGESAHTTVYERLECDDVRQRISIDGQHRLTHTQPILKWKIAERGRDDIRSWIESTWIALGGPACLQNAADMDDASAFFQLLSTFGQYDEPFSIKKLLLKMEKLFAAPQQDEAAVQLMTIHSAKGLEFDTVILPHLERKSAADSRSLLLWMEQTFPNGEAALLLAPIQETGGEKDTIYHYIDHQQKMKSYYETDRLLYVATTRAKNNLYLLFHTYQKENGTYYIESGSLLKKLWPLFEKQADPIISSDFSNSLIEPTHSIQRYTFRLSSDWKNPIPFLPITTITAHIKPGGFLLVDKNPKLIGTVTHRVLQYMAERGISWWQRANISQQRYYIMLHLKQLGMPLINLEGSTHHIQRIIRNVLNDERGRWILYPHKQAQSELAITAMMHTSTENLIIDRTFIDEKGTRWIIDYKTSMPEKQNIEKYSKKMLQYAEAMQQLQSNPIRLGLYFPALPAWTEWAAHFPH